MRERLLAVRFAIFMAGITPARAGKTLSLLHKGRRPQDHPRSCGKDRLLSPLNISVPGSPPLVRERLVKVTRGNNVLGITPARAGKTYHGTVHHTLLWDHPRSCGKDATHGLYKKAAMGSPPLVRERRDNPEDPTTTAGITPARAGKTIAHHGNLASP